MLALLAFAAALAAPEPGPVCEAQWADPARGGRIVPVRIRMPAGTGKVPVILFSHGLGGSLDAGTLWAQAWVADGDAVIHLQHAGSGSRMIGRGLILAMNATQAKARVADVGFVLDQLAARKHEGACDLTRLDLNHAGMAGHSFGAQTTLMVAGARTAGNPAADPRIRAAIAFSPQPATGVADAAAFGAMTMPFFSITGTEDKLPMLNQVTPQDRERPFRAMPAGSKYLMVLNGANHMMYSGQDNIRLPNTAPLAHVRDAVTQATTLFWRATLKGDTAAKRELDAFAATLPAGDRFERK